MPGDMAMQDPETGVIRAESDCEISVRWKQSDVSARRVVVVEDTVGQVVWCVASVLLSEDGEVVTVEMHGMSGFDEGFGLQCLAERVTAHRYDHVDPVILFVVFCNQAVFFRVERVVVEVVDGRVREIEPHG